MEDEIDIGTLPARRKIGWGIGGAAEAWMASGMGNFTGPIYTIALHMDPAKLGLIGSIPRLLDAVYDIWLGNLSDNTRTRWGRRRPFIAIGAVVCAIFFVAIGWMPLGFSVNGKLAYFTAASMGYWLAFGTYAIPYNALGYELTNDYNERTSVQAHRYFSIQISGLILGAFYWLCFAKIFTRHVPAGVAPEVIGARWVSLIFAAMILVTGLAPAIVSRENPVNEAHPRVPLMSALKLTFSDRLFLHFIAMIIVSISGVSIASGLGLFIVIYHIYGGERAGGANLMFKTSEIIAIGALILTPLIPKLGKVMGKKGLIILGQGMMAIGGLGAWLFYTPRHPYLLMIPAMISTAGLACFQILYGSFIGDICDVDELKTGTRREGMYSAAATFLNKIVYAFLGALSGFVLTWTGYRSADTIQTVATITHMRMAFAILPAAFAVLGFGFAFTFPVTAKSAEITREALANRHRLT